MDNASAYDPSYFDGGSSSPSGWSADGRFNPITVREAHVTVSISTRAAGAATTQAPTASASSSAASYEIKFADGTVQRFVLVDKGEVTLLENKLNDLALGLKAMRDGTIVSYLKIDGYEIQVQTSKPGDQNETVRMQMAYEAAEKMGRPLGWGLGALFGDPKLGRQIGAPAAWILGYWLRSVVETDGAATWIGDSAHWTRYKVNWR